MSPELREIHTSDLCDPCMHRVQLRLEGKIVPSVATAMSRGLLVHQMLQLMHERDEWDPEVIIKDAVGEMLNGIEDEQRSLTTAASDKLDSTLSDSIRLGELYADRFRERFQKCKLIGCELPVSWDVDPSLPRFASHIDLMVRDQDGVFGQGPNALLLFDWKTSKESPTAGYLGRHLQLICYWASVRFGRVMIEDTWVPMGEFPRTVYVHIPSLKPYYNTAVGKDDRGEKKTYRRGDMRPDRSVLRFPEFRPDRADDAVEHIKSRMAMIEGGVFPKTVTETGCHICEARDWCDRFDTASLSWE